MNQAREEDVDLSTLALLSFLPLGTKHTTHTHTTHIQHNRDTKTCDTVPYEFVWLWSQFPCSFHIYSIEALLHFHHHLAACPPAQAQGSQTAHKHTNNFTHKQHTKHLKHMYFQDKRGRLKVPHTQMPCEPSNDSSHLIRLQANELPFI
jgi:hypothetical protein